MSEAAWRQTSGDRWRLLRGNIEVRVWRRRGGGCECVVRKSSGDDPAKWAGVLHRTCATPEEARAQAEAMIGVLEALK
jgi:cobalamin biosynthesis protein CbiD